MKRNFVENLQRFCDNFRETKKEKIEGIEKKFWTNVWDNIGNFVNIFEHCW